MPCGNRLHTALFQHRKGCDLHEFIQQVHIHRMYQVYGEAQSSRLLPGDPVFFNTSFPSCSKQKHCKQYCKRIIVCHLDGKSCECPAEDHSHYQHCRSDQPHIPYPSSSGRLRMVSGFHAFPFSRRCGTLCLVHTYFSHHEEISTQIIQEIHTAIRQYRNTVDIQHLIQKRCHTASQEDHCYHCYNTPDRQNLQHFFQKRCDQIQKQYQIQIPHMRPCMSRQSHLQCLRDHHDPKAFLRHHQLGSCIRNAK